MPDNEFQIEALGSVYAQALINEAQKQHVLADVTEDVRGIGTLLRENKAFHAFSQALTISEDKQQASLEKILGGRVHPLTLQALKAMSRRGRLMFLGGLVEGFEAILRKMDGHVDVSMISATELRPEVVGRVKDAVVKSTGSKSVDVKVKVDPALIGGMTLIIGDTQIDGSVATQLDRMKEQLKRGRIKPEAVVA